MKLQTPHTAHICPQLKPHLGPQLSPHLRQGFVGQEGFCGQKGFVMQEGFGRQADLNKLSLTSSFAKAFIFARASMNEDGGQELVLQEILCWRKRFGSDRTFKSFV